jgi:type IV/VI secretion system ImpK/VasF family protein
MSTEAAQALRTAYVELFWLAGRLRSGAVPGSRVPDVRNHADAQLRQQRRTLLRADVEEGIIDDAELAVIALLDESAQLSAARDCAEQWMSRLLQYEHYKHSNLGRDFFERLESLRRRPDTPLPLLELYARALAWGFEGRYREENRQEDLAILADALRAELLHRLPEPPLCAPLSGRVAPPRVAPLFAAPWVLGLGASLILLVGVVLSALLYYHASTTTAVLRQLAEPESAPKTPGAAATE